MITYIIDCLKHKVLVFLFISIFCIKLMWRAIMHDLSKFHPYEAKLFSKITKKIKKTEYGSEEYKNQLKSIRPAIDHHYAMNRHHFEHYNYVDIKKEMGLIDFVELFFDWKAAVKRNKNGNLEESIKKNKERFNYSDDLANLMRNSI